MAKHRKPSERQRWVREWRRSKLSASEFCARHGAEGLKPGTLYDWARQVEREQIGVTALSAPRLVEAIPVGSSPAIAWAWELEGPGGVLRGGVLDPAVFAELLVAVTGAQR